MHPVSGGAVSASLPLGLNVTQDESAFQFFFLHRRIKIAAMQYVLKCSSPLPA